VNIYILGTIAILTLALNLFLVFYLLTDKNDVYSNDGSKEEVINFVLSSAVQNELASETEILETEIIASGDNNNE
jgi:hypothetical protein